MPKSDPGKSPTASPHDEPIERKGDGMKTEMDSDTLDTPHPLTDEQRANLKALSARSDNGIDYNDICVGGQAAKECRSGPLL
jgi:hypothetical protein